MIHKLITQWPVKLVVLLIMTQVMMSHLANFQIDFASLNKNTHVSIFTPCPKAEVAAKTAQQLCKNQLATSLTSNLPLISLLILSGSLIVFANENARYELLTYPIYKPPKS